MSSPCIVYLPYRRCHGKLLLKPKVISQTPAGTQMPPGRGTIVHCEEQKLVSLAFFSNVFNTLNLIAIFEVVTLNNKGYRWGPTLLTMGPNLTIQPLQPQHTLYMRTQLSRNWLRRAPQSPGCCPESWSLCNQITSPCASAPYFLTIAPSQQCLAQRPEPRPGVALLGLLLLLHLP